MEIKKIINNKEKYMNLLLEADPDESVVKQYINNGEMYVAFEGEEAVCEIIVTEVDNEVCELKNIATLENSRGKGYAQKLIKYVFKEYTFELNKTEYIDYKNLKKVIETDSAYYLFINNNRSLIVDKSKLKEIEIDILTDSLKKQVSIYKYKD